MSSDEFASRTEGIRTLDVELPPFDLLRRRRNRRRLEQVGAISVALALATVAFVARIGHDDHAPSTSTTTTSVVATTSTTAVATTTSTAAPSSTRVATSAPSTSTMAPGTTQAPVTNPISRLRDTSTWEPLQTTGLSGVGPPLVAAMGNEVLVVRSPRAGEAGRAAVLDTATMRWRKAATAPAAIVGYGTNYTWTGQVLYVVNDTATLFSYTPSNDTWRTVRSVAPVASFAVLSWSGTEVVVTQSHVPGDVGTSPFSPYAYNPATDTIRPLSPQPSDIAFDRKPGLTVARGVQKIFDAATGTGLWLPAPSGYNAGPLCWTGDRATAQLVESATASSSRPGELDLTTGTWTFLGPPMPLIGGGAVCEVDDRVVYFGPITGFFRSDGVYLRRDGTWATVKVPIGPNGGNAIVTTSGELIVTDGHDVALWHPLADDP